MRKLTTEEFVSRAHDVHGDQYDYSLVKYEGSKTPVKILCPEHGLFEQNPNVHLKGCGCTWCANNEKKKMFILTTKEFIERAREVHGNQYDYSLVKYEGAHTKVRITCPEHGVFEQVPGNHLALKQGCPKCGVKQRSDKKRLGDLRFIRCSREVHGNQYDYSLVKYIDNKTPVKITCPEHGIFKQRPDMHLHQKQGCPQCAQNGFNPAKHAVLYILADDKQLPLFLKIGVTNNFKQRLTQLRRETPHPVEKLVVYPFPHGGDAYKLEQEVHEVFRELNAGMSGFNGATEWFKYSPAILDYVRLHV